jgi:hypothetical protein
MKLKTTGTKKSVATVAKSRPPITARPSGAFCSPPFAEAQRHRKHADDHRQRRHQDRPETRVSQPPARPPSGVFPASSLSFEKLTTRMLFAVATPMHMIAPVSAGTLIVVSSQTESRQSRQRGGQRHQDDEGIEPRLEIHHDQQIDEHDRKSQSRQQAVKRRIHGLNLPAHEKLGPRRQFLSGFVE